MRAGSVSIDAAGNASGDGMSLALYNLISTTEQTANPLPDPNTPDKDFDGTASEWKTTFLAQVIKIKQAWARQANEHATVLAMRSPRTLSTSQTLTASDDVILVQTRSGAITLQLPTGGSILAGSTVEIIEIGNDGTHTITVAPGGGDSLVGATTVAALSKRTFFRTSSSAWIGY